ncbi:MAG: S-adenosylmethionine decarboxylase [Sedimenticola sp.]|nr:S-adenosylmethionine decarboxylase [Sedimenticola sp.]
MALCPEIFRQRAIIEGLYGINEIDEQTVTQVLQVMTATLGMTPIAELLIFSPDQVSKLHHGIGGFQAWAESGCSLYTWREQKLFTLELYSCKPFHVDDCILRLQQLLQVKCIEWRDIPFD